MGLAEVVATVEVVGCAAAVGGAPNQVGQRFGQVVGKVSAVGEQDFRDAVELGDRIGGSLCAGAGDEDVDVPTDRLRRRQRLGGLIGNAAVVVFCQKKNGHIFVSLFFRLKARRLRS